VFAYFGFWHITLYWLNWGERPFHSERQWRWSKIIHNLWYTFLGALQWTVWEVIFMHSYATERLPYLSDEKASTTLWGAFNFVACFFLVPLYRELHFYFAHRLIHVKVLFKYVHSLHHRNTDIEPFAGLCMHPIEHLYYFSCIAPSLYCYASPFAFMWNGVHLLISPAASHSGWEDNWQSDQFHYLHHRFFECNYGTGTFPFDIWFGTFRESLDYKKDKAYKGEHTDSGELKLDPKSAAIADSKATLWGFPRWDEAVFNLLCVGLIPTLIACAALKVGPQVGDARLLASLMSFGPALIGGALLYSSQRWTGFKKMFLYPFHKESLLGSFGFNCAMGVLLTMLPVYHMVYMLLAPPGQSAYCQIYGSCV